MAEPVLTDVLGTGTTQDASSITIPKANLPGLTPAADNTAESIIAALTLLLASTLSQANQDSNADQQITVIDSGFPTFVTRGDIQYRQETYNFNFQTPDLSTGINPGDY